MIPDLSSIFTRYEALRAEVDDLFCRVRGAFPQCVVCKEGCSDCCHALFDLSLIEAIYINRAFESSFGYGPQRSGILERASELDRRATRIKRELYRAEKDGESPEAIMERAAQVKLRCLCWTTTTNACCTTPGPSPAAYTACPRPLPGRGMCAAFRLLKKASHTPPSIWTRARTGLKT